MKRKSGFITAAFTTILAFICLLIFDLYLLILSILNGIPGNNKISYNFLLFLNDLFILSILSSFLFILWKNLFFYNSTKEQIDFKKIFLIIFLIGFLMSLTSTIIDLFFIKINLDKIYFNLSLDAIKKIGIATLFLGSVGLLSDASERRIAEQGLSSKKEQKSL